MQAERGIEDTSNQIWSRDDGLAVYQSQKQADYVGRYHGMRVKLTGSHGQSETSDF